MRLPDTNHQSFKRVAFSLIAVTMFLMIINVAMSARVARDGLAIDISLKKQESLKKANDAIEQQLFAKTALTDLSEYAANLGYVSASEFVTINPAGSIAKRP
jgi:hypothetical protein